VNRECQGGPLTVEQRVEELEQELHRTNRRIRFLSVGLASCFGIGLTAWILRPHAVLAQNSTPPSTREVRANRFVLEDEKGRARAELQMHDDGPRLAMIDKTGVVRLALHAGENGVGLGLFNEKGRGVAGLAITKDATGLSIMDREGKTRAALLLEKNRSQALMLNDGRPDGTSALFSVADKGSMLSLDRAQSQVLLCASKAGPSIDLTDSKGVSRANLTVVKEVSGLYISDENGTHRAALDYSEHGPALDLIDVKGKIRASLGAGMMESSDGKRLTYPESSLYFFGPDGKLRWTAP